MKDIADTYCSFYPNTRFHITDGSLECGGCNDYTHNWSNPHRGHRTGLNFDVDDQDGISLWGQRGDSFAAVCNSKSVTPARHGGPPANHWHLDFPE